MARERLDKGANISSSETERTALVYLTRGWPVIPVEARGKRPLVSWEEFQHRLPSQAEVRAWFGRRADANVAIVTGAVSGLVVLDVDPRHGGSASLAELERRHGAVPPSVEARSGGGGRHLYFAHPGGRVHNRVALAPGLDLRGDGGLVAPPSRHASGGRYVWKAGCAPEDRSLAELPAWLLETARRPGPLRSPAHWKRLLRAGVTQGERNNTIASLTGHLLWHDVDPEIAVELLLCWNRVRCRPPLADDEIVRTVKSICRTHFRNPSTIHD